jgi:hypothetical protein
VQVVHEGRQALVKSTEWVVNALSGRSIVLIGAHSPADLEAVEVGEHHVEHHDVWYRIR